MSDSGEWFWTSDDAPDFECTSWFAAFLLAQPDFGMSLVYIVSEALKNVIKR